MRLFKVKHQTVTIELDFDNRFVKGVTEIFIEPKTDQLRYIHLNCENPSIYYVAVNSIKSRFICNKLKDEDEEQNRLSCRYDLINSTELEIEIPEEVKMPILDPENPQTKDSKSSANLSVKIWFSVSDLNSGIIYNPSGPEKNSTPVIYIESNVRPGYARRWLPCIDDLHEGMTWDLRYIVPSYLNIDQNLLQSTVVVSSGELAGLAKHPIDPNKKIYNYILSAATPACALAFAAGGFSLAMKLDKPTDKKIDEHNETLEHLNSSDHNKKNEEANEGDNDYSVENLFGDDFKSDEDEEQKEKPKQNNDDDSIDLEAIGGIFAFGADIFQKEIEETTEFITDAVSFYSKALGSYPFTTYKIVFIDGLKIPIISGASITLASMDLVYPKNSIEPAYESRRILSLAISYQWFGVYVVPEKCYIDQPCILDSDEYEFMMLKAPIVLYMLNKRMIKRGASLGLMRVVPRLLVSAMSGDLGSSNSISTSSFLKLCKKVSGVDLKSFADQWIFGTGCPIFKFSYAFNRKKLVVELSMVQESTNAFSTTSYSKSQIFTGQMTARVREADGTPYEHVLDINSNQQKFEVQFNTKYKRIRRNTKRFHLRQIAAAAEEFSANAELLGAPIENDDEVYSNIALFGAENEEEKRNWRIVEWGEDDEESLVSSTFEWLRMDSDMEWACIIYFEQPDYMWAAQLQKDRDVVAQIEAVEALEKLPSSAASTTLMRTIMDGRVYYRVRAEAALALSKFATLELDWIGLYHLVKIYKSRYCISPATGSINEDYLNGDEEDIDVPRLPKKNNFSSIGEYFTLKAIIASLSNITDDNGSVPVSVKNILFNALKYNDNSENMYSDSFYLSGIINAIANSVSKSLVITRSSSSENLSSKAFSECKNAITEIERLRRLDALVPSYKNVVTVSAINAMHKILLVCRDLSVIDHMLPLAMTLPGNFTDVRISAFRLLLSYFGLENGDAVNYLFISAVSDNNHKVSKCITSDVVQAIAYNIMQNEYKLNTEKAIARRKSENQSKGSNKETNESNAISSKLALENSDQSFSVKNMFLAIEVMLKNLNITEETVHLLYNSLTNPKLEIEHRQYLIKIKDFLHNFPNQIQKQAYASSKSRSSNIPKRLKIRVTGHSRNKNSISSYRSASPTLSNDYNMYSFSDFEDRMSPSFPPLGQDLSSVITMRIPALSTSKMSPNHNPQENNSLKGSATNSSTPVIKLKLKSQKTDENLETLGSEENKSKSKKPKHRLSLGGVPFNDFANVNKKGSSKKMNSLKLKSLQQFRMLENGEVVENRMPIVKIDTNPDMLGLDKSIKIEGSVVKQKVKDTNLLFNLEFGSSKQKTTKKNPLSKAVITKKMRKILKKIATHKSAGPFLRPVDPISDGCPDYFDVIKSPIDLSTIQARIEEGKYAQLSDFSADVELMFSNCFKFNPENTIVYKIGRELEAFFKHHLDKATTELESIKTQHDQSLENIPLLSIKNTSNDMIVSSSKPNIPQITAELDDSIMSLAKQHLGLLISDNAKVKSSGGIVIKKIKLFSSKQQKAKLKEKAIELPAKKPIINKLILKISKKEPTENSNTNTSDLNSGKSEVIGENETLNQGESKTLLKILRKLQTHPSGLEFLQPVDPVKQQVPDYYNVVKKPMDLSTIESKLVDKKYKTKELFYDDVNLIVKNCNLFNPEGSFVYEQGRQLLELFNSLWIKEMERLNTFGKKNDNKRIFDQNGGFRDIDDVMDTDTKDLDFSVVSDQERGLKAIVDVNSMDQNSFNKCRQMLSKLSRKQFATPFLVPVDPEKLGIPTYFDIVKHPMDLGTVKAHLLTKRYYKLVSDFISDVQLVFDNCFLFNPKDTWVYEWGKKMESTFHEMVNAEGWGSLM
ncbi:hypothetical protein BB559_001219 [Furculomyces boomerangus]|uniref:Transcription initiation factor TFIID subunit 2 n=2 Tax=Harpellales TaxID=61421 RepID=A0A2T9Z2R9_9FUNG|nr:hypothetical protein BB559_001219 [Furculomyces boomerangus]